MFPINKFEFANFDEAWQGLNEYLANKGPRIIKRGGGVYSSEMVSYDNFIYVWTNKLSPDFNFGKALGYRNKKWSKLINNYVNMNYLDLVKSEVVAREGRRAKHYNFTFHFDNSHSSGKDCLISLTFCRRKGKEHPMVIYNTRASEVTSRLVFDFLLIQRICEYVYGADVNCEVLCIIPFMFINIERFLIYMGHRGRDVAVKVGKKGPNDYQKKLLNKFDDFLNKPIELIKYRVHKRSALQVKRNPDGTPQANVKDLFAKELTFPYNKKFRLKDIEKLNKSLIP